VYVGHRSYNKNDLYIIIIIICSVIKVVDGALLYISNMWRSY